MFCFCTYVNSLLMEKVMCLPILSSFWFKLLASEKARDWVYFPILINIQFSPIIITSKMYDFLDVTSKNCIAIQHRRSDVSEWSCYNFKGVFLHNSTSQISNYSNSFSPR